MAADTFNRFNSSLTPSCSHANPVSDDDSASSVDSDPSSSQAKRRWSDSSSLLGNRRVTFDVVIDLSTWYILNDEFTVSIVSPGTNGRRYDHHGKFECCFQQDTRCIYRCRLPIPGQALQRNNGSSSDDDFQSSFCYKYVVKIKKGQRTVPRYETLAMYGSEWRVLKASVSYQYDPEIRPYWTNQGLPVVSLITAPSPTEVVTTAQSALSEYMDWIRTKKRGAYIDISDAEREIRQHAIDLKEMIWCLMNPCHFVDGSVTEIMTDELRQSIYQTFLSKIPSLLAQVTPGVQNFLSSLVVAEAFACIGIISDRVTCFKDDPNSTKAILAALHIPSPDFISCIKILSNFSQKLKTSILSVAVHMCNNLASSSPTSPEWMGVLPLLHVIKLDQFVPGQPYQLPLHGRDIKVPLFCGVNIQEIITCDDQDHFVSEAMSLILPYFRHDWLMPRAFIAVCPYEKIPQYIGIYPEMSSFACWMIGRRDLPRMDLNNNDQIDLLSQQLEVLLQCLKNVTIQKEEHALCFKGISDIVHTLADQGIDVPVFLSSVQFFLTVLDQVVPFRNSWQSVEEDIDLLCNQVLVWMEKVHGTKLHSADLLEELEDWSGVFSMDVCREKLTDLCTERITATLTTRLNKIDHRAKFKILTDAVNKSHSKVIDVFAENIAQSARKSEESIIGLWMFLYQQNNLLGTMVLRDAQLGEVAFIDFYIEQINMRGIYYIEASPGKVTHSVDDLIRLRMMVERKERLIGHRLLLNKVALDSVKNTDNFTLFREMVSKIVRIAVLLIKLQEAGLVEYTHFNLRCLCSEYRKADFDAVIASMKEALVNWQAARHHRQYPYLNYYTSQQLLDLQSELGKLRRNPDLMASRELKQLLVSMVPYPLPSQKNIVTALNNAFRKAAQAQFEGNPSIQIEEECHQRITHNFAQWAGATGFSIEMNVPDGEYLSLVELGEVLTELACERGPVMADRSMDATIG